MTGEAIASPVNMLKYALGLGPYTDLSTTNAGNLTGEFEQVSR